MNLNKIACAAAAALLTAAAGAATAPWLLSNFLVRPASP